MEKKLTEFKAGCYYTAKETIRVATIVAGGFGLTASVRVVHKGERLQYYDGKLIFDSGNEGFNVGDELIDKFEVYYSKEDLEKWEELRLQYAGQAMQTLIRPGCEPFRVAVESFKFADAMIDILKEEVYERCDN